MSEFVQQMLTGMPTVVIGNLIGALKCNTPSSISTNENQENDDFGTTLNQMIIAYDRIWSELDLLQRIDWSLRLKTRCLDCLQVHKSLINKQSFKK